MGRVALTPKQLFVLRAIQASELHLEINRWMYGTWNVTPQVKALVRKGFLDSPTQISVDGKELLTNSE